VKAQGVGPGKLRVLIADDSAFMRHILAARLGAEPDIEVVGVARDGVEALEGIERLRPDAMTLDLQMPRLSGIDVLARLRGRMPCAVVILSSAGARDVEETFRALDLGALDFVAKPEPGNARQAEAVWSELVAKLRAAVRPRGRATSALASVFPTTERPLPRPLPLPGYGVPAAPRIQKVPGRPLRITDRVVIIGSSTGGPNALQRLLPSLPGGLPAAIVVVQHMPAGFTRSLAVRLDEHCPFPVYEATSGSFLRAGEAVIAPGDYRVGCEPGGRVVLGQSGRVRGVRPSVDVCLISAAEVFRRRVIAVILTGMGRDGSDGAGEVRAAGGYVLAEHESSCVVYGMPRAVIEDGHAHVVAPLDELPAAICRAIEVRSAASSSPPWRK